MVLGTKTIYGVLAALDNIFSPGSTKFSDYVKNTCDDNLFLRTAFCKKWSILEDRPLPEETTHIVIGSNREIDEDYLHCEWTDDPFEHEQTMTKLQISFVSADKVVERERWTVSMGYPICYTIEITSDKGGAD